MKAKDNATVHLKRFFGVAAILGNAVAYSGPYDHCVQFDTASDNCIFTMPSGWSSHERPKAGSSYYINRSGYVCFGTKGTNFILGDDGNAAFEGDELFVGSSATIGVCNNGFYSVWGKTHFLPGAKMKMWSYSHIKGGPWYIETTEESPLTYTVGRSDSAASLNWEVDLIGNSDAHVKLAPRYPADGAGKSNFGPIFLVNADWSGYYGRFTCATGTELRLATNFSCPGRIVLPPTSILNLRTDAGRSEVGAIEIGNTSSLMLGSGKTTSGQILAVAKGLVLSDGAMINPDRAVASTPYMTSNHVGGVVKPLDEQYLPESKVFLEFSSEAVEAGIPANLLACVQYEHFTKTGTEADSVIPQKEIRIDDCENGGRLVGLSYKRWVKLLANSANVFKPTCNPGSEFSDGLLPHAGTDYYTEGAVNLDHGDNTKPWTFAGDLLSFAWHVSLFHDETINLEARSAYNEDAVPHPRVRGYNGITSSYHLRGKILVSTLSKGSKALWFTTGDGNTYYIHSDISGDSAGISAIRIHNDNAYSNVDKRHYWGCCDFSGDNRGFMGKWIVQGPFKNGKPWGWNDGYGAYVGGPGSNATMRVHCQANLGGPMSGFTYDSLTVSNQQQLVLCDTATYDDKTRGWYFPGERAYLGVMSNAVAKVLSRITLGGELVKVDSGTLLFGETETDSGDRIKKITVQGGSIGVASAEALNGRALEFAKGTKFHVSANAGEALGSKGMLFTAEGSSLSMADSKLSVYVDTVGVEDSQEDDFSVPVMTVRDKTIGAKLRAMNDEGRKMSVESTANQDGTFTIWASNRKPGLMLIFR